MAELDEWLVAREDVEALAAELRERLAVAWDEGFHAGCHPTAPLTNPYREEAEADWDGDAPDWTLNRQ